MSEEVLKEISKLLETILVFETKFKEEILAKTKDLDNAGLQNLKRILSEVVEWQRKVLEEKFKQDPGFYNKIVGARKKVDQEIISLYKQKLNDEDHKKMGIILNRINSV